MNNLHLYASPAASATKDPTAFISPTSVFPDENDSNTAQSAEHSILNLPPNRTNHTNNNTDVVMTQCILSDELLSAPSTTTTTASSEPSLPNANGNTGNTSGDMGTMLISDALQYVLHHEGRTFRNLESLALSHGFAASAETPSQRLVRALITGRSSSQFNDSVKKIETCLGKWVVHNYTYKTAFYRPAENESAVLARISSSNVSGNGGNGVLFDAWMANISEWAKAEKVRYKQVLDARKDALDGILGLERARLVNNQKSAHLSKFQSNLIEHGKTNLIKWFVDDKYSALINAAYFKQRIDK